MQGAVELSSGATNVRNLHRQLVGEGISHLLLVRNPSGTDEIYLPPLNELEKAGCLVKLKQFQVLHLKSRTLPSLSASTQILDLLKLKDASCLG